MSRPLIEFLKFEKVATIVIGTFWINMQNIFIDYSKGVTPYYHMFDSILLFNTASSLASELFIPQACFLSVLLRAPSYLDIFPENIPIFGVPNQFRRFQQLVYGSEFFQLQKAPSTSVRRVK